MITSWSECLQLVGALKWAAEQAVKAAEMTVGAAEYQEQDGGGSAATKIKASAIDLVTQARKLLAEIEVYAEGKK